MCSCEPLSTMECGSCNSRPQSCRSTLDCPSTLTTYTLQHLSSNDLGLGGRGNYASLGDGDLVLLHQIHANVLMHIEEAPLDARGLGRIVRLRNEVRVCGTDAR